MLNITICTLALGDEYKKIVKYGIRSKKSYCQKQKYDYHDDEDVYDKSRPHAWSKVNLILRYIDQYDFIMWIDADTLIMNPDIRIEERIKDMMTEDIDISLVSDHTGPNTGIMLIRCTKWAKNFWKTLYDQHQFINVRTWEQAAFRHMLNTNMLNSQQHIKVWHFDYSRLINCTYGVFRYGVFIIHFIGCYHKNKQRLLPYLMDKFCPFQRDDETTKDFDQRIAWLKTITNGISASDLNIYKYVD